MEKFRDSDVADEESDEVFNDRDGTVVWRAGAKLDEWGWDKWVAVIFTNGTVAVFLVSPGEDSVNKVEAKPIEFERNQS